MMDSTNFFSDLELMPTFGLGRDQISIEFDVTRFARRTLPIGLEAEIERVWRQKTNTNRRLYNGSKFRLHRAWLSSSDEDRKKLSLQVGLTDYKDLIGTHYSPKCHLMVKEAEDEKDPFCFMSNAIGVGAITLTSDEFLVFVLRADWTGEYAGCLDRPGGHPEPSLVIEAKEKGKSDVSQLPPDQILEELVMSPQKELRDEINIPLENQVESKLLGIMRTLSTGGRVNFDFLVKLNITRDELQKRYALGNQDEADESVHLFFLRLEEVRSWTVSAAVLKRMTPHCRGGLRLLYMMMQEEDGVC